MKLVLVSGLAFVCSVALGFGAYAQSASCETLSSTVASKFPGSKLDLISMYFNSHGDAEGGKLPGPTSANEGRLRYRAPERERYVIVMELGDSVSRNVGNNGTVTVLDRVTGRTMSFKAKAPKYPSSGAAYQYHDGGMLMPRSSNPMDGAAIEACKPSGDSDPRICMSKEDYAAFTKLLGNKTALVVQIPSNESKANRLRKDLPGTPNNCKLLNSNLGSSLYSGGLDADVQKTHLGGGSSSDQGVN